ncbi:MAG: GDSL-type esterase/lipase family protein [Erysipelotrichaceae bacterium]
MKRILIYGDSNTWGYNSLGGRYENRWPRLLTGYEIVEEGINGRTTVFDDYKPYRNGLSGLGYVLIAAKPIDLLIIQLGINDLKFTDAEGSGQGLREILDSLSDVDIQYPGTNSDIFTDIRRILIVSAVESDQEESKKLASIYEEIAREYNCFFLNPNKFVKSNDIDHIHLDEINHRKLAIAMQIVIDDILGE